VTLSDDLGLNPTPDTTAPETTDAPTSAAS
jgi:hypothetical protein